MRAGDESDYTTLKALYLKLSSFSLCARLIPTIEPLEKENTRKSIA